MSVASLPRPSAVGVPASLAAAAVMIAVGLAVTVQVPSGTPIVALVAAGVIALSAWMLLTERYELSLAVLMLYVGLADGYLKLKTGSQAATIARDLLLYSIAAGALIRAAVRRERFDPPPLTGWVLAWVVVVAVQMLNPGNGSLTHSLAALRPHIEWVPLFFLGYMAVRSKRHLRGFLLLLLAVTAINGVVSLVQFNLTPEEFASWGPGYEERISGEGDVSTRSFVDDERNLRNRPFGLGSDFGFGGTLGLLAVSAALALLSLGRHHGLRAATMLLSVGVVTAVVTSQARVAIIGAIVAAFAFAVLTVSSRAGFRSLLALGLTALVAYGAVSFVGSSSEEGSLDRYSDIASPEQAVNTAYESRRETLALIPRYAVDFPLGAGIGSKGPAASFGEREENRAALNAESEPTYLLIELGLPGLIVLLGLNLKLFTMSVRRIRRLCDRELRILLTGIAAPLFALFSTWVVGVATATTPSAPYFWFAAGVLAYWLGREQVPGDAGSESSASTAPPTPIPPRSPAPVSAAAARAKALGAVSYPGQPAAPPRGSLHRPRLWLGRWMRR